MIGSEKVKRWLASPVLYGVLVCVVFLLCDRSLSIYFIKEIPVMRQIFIHLSRICAVCVMGYFFYRRKSVNKIFFVCLAGVYGLLLLATLLSGEGNLRRWLGAAYPILAMTAFVSVECATVDGIKRFLKPLAWLFSVLAVVNLLQMLFLPNIFGMTDNNGYIYLIGLENQIIYPMTVGLLIVVLNDRFNRNKLLLYIYTAVYFVTAFINFSVGSVAGVAVLLLYYLLPPIKKLYRKQPLWVFLIGFAVIFAVLVFFHEPVLNFPPIKFIIEEVLQKDVTLTNRTLIWEVAVRDILRAPLLGYGVPETGNVFAITAWNGIQWLSAHNQFLQTWYEGGTLTVLGVIIFLLLGSKALASSSDKPMAGYIKVIATAVLVMYLVEAPSFESLFFVLTLGGSIVLTLEKQRKHIAEQNAVRTDAEDDRISVVVPVYNVEKYLDECLTSIVSQSYRNLEIIVVNDGATDNSFEICRRYAEKDSRIILLSQENAGLSAARNTGIKAATGKYITFVDSDDALNPDMIRYLYDIMQQHSADMSICQKEWTDEESRVIPRDVEYPDAVVEGTENCVATLFGDIGLDATAHGKLYKTEMFADVQYPVGKYHEDEYTTYRVLALCERVVIGSRREYQYRQRAGSIMHSAYSPKHLHAIEASAERAAYLDEHYPRLAPLSKAWIVYSANVCLFRMMRSGFYDEETAAYLQKQYRRYEGLFWLGNSRLSAKIFSLIPFISVKLCLKVASTLKGKGR